MRKLLRNKDSKMKKIIIYIAIGLGIFCTNTFNAQVNNFINPNGGISLNTNNTEGIFSTAEINESEGVPQIEIPLLNIKAGDINYPVKLLYDARGIKTNQRASNVGLGWTLFLPAITRQINDANDFDDNVNGSTGYGPKRVGYFTKNNNNIKYNFSNHNGNDFINIDELPDQYTAVLLDGGSSFFFENEDSYQLMTRKRIKINPTKESHLEMQNPNYTNTDFYKISILNDNGLRYNFDEVEICNFMFAENYFNTPGMVSELLPTISNWKISNIKDLKNNELSFEYAPAQLYNDTNYYYAREINSGFYSKLTDFQSQSVSGYYYNILTPYTNQLPGLHLKGFIDSGASRIVPNNFTPSYEYKSIVETKNYKKLSNLTKIKFNEGYVKFNYDYNRTDSQTGEKALSSIELFDFNDKLIKKYNFIYSYFDNADPNSNVPELDHIRRLRLDKIVDLNNLSYEFNYDNTPLPSLNSKAFDYAGYYNGSIEIEGYTNMPDESYYYPNLEEWSLLPFRLNPSDTHGNNYFFEHIIQYGANGITREPNYNYAKAGILSDIIFPTKGTKNFEYELNDFKIFEKIQTSPGLRIKKINFKEGNNNLRSISYKYLDNFGYSSGKMLNPPYIGYPKTQLFKAEKIYNNQDPNYGTIVSDYNGLQNFNSNKLGMLFKVIDKPSEIKVYYNRVEKSENERGKTVTEYTNNDEFMMGKSGYSPGFSPSTSTPLSSVFPYWVNISSQNGVFTSNGYNFVEFLSTNSAYKLRYNSIIDYSKLGQITNQKIYDNLGTLLSEKKVNYKYVHPDFPFSADKIFSKPILNTVSNSFLGSGFIYSPQGTVTIKNYYTAQLLESTEETSFFMSGNVYKKLFYEYYINDHSMPVTHTYEIEPDGFIKGKIFKFQRFDNPSVINNNLLTQVVGIGTFNGYDILDDYNRPYMINDSYETVYLSDATTNNILAPKSEIQTKRPNYSSPEVSNIIKEFKLYDNKGNLLEYSIGDKGIPITKIWGYKQSFPIAEVEGIKYTELMQLLGLPTSSTGYLNLDIVTKSNLDVDAASEQSLIDTLDIFRKNAALKDYKITTYTHDPLVGIKSVTSPTGIKEVYIYDLSNKLKEVRENSVGGNIIKEYKYNYKP